jgi:hypothetical protein
MLVWVLLQFGILGCKFFLHTLKNFLQVSGRRGKQSKISKVLTVYMMSGIGLWLGGIDEEIFGGPCTHVVALQSCASFNLQVHSLCFS